MILSKDFPQYTLVADTGRLIAMSDAADDILDLHFQHPGSHLGKTAEMSWTMPVPVPHLANSPAEAAVHAALLPYVTPTPRQVQQLTTALLVRPNRFYFDGQKIKAIKETRAMFSIGLGEAKAVIDTVWPAFDTLVREGTIW